MRQGEVRWYTFTPPDKRRPVLLLTRASAISFLNSVTVAPITTQIRDIPTEVLLTPEEDGVHEVCVVNLDNIQTVQKQRLGPLITTLSFRRMQDAQRALRFAVGMDEYLTPVFNR